MKKKAKMYNWERAFDRKFQLIDDMDWDRPLQKEVKDFIKSKIIPLYSRKYKV